VRQSCLRAPIAEAVAEAVPIRPGLDLPRYSPEFNPIEQAWAKVKERLKAKAARTLEALEAELKPALNAITAQDARGWIRHAGYALH
jgi:transposase